MDIAINHAEALEAAATASVEAAETVPLQQTLHDVAKRLVDALVGS